MEDKHGRMKVTVGYFATFPNDKSDEDIIKDIVAKVPEMEKHKNHIIITRKETEAYASFKEGYSSSLDMKTKQALLQLGISR